ncbi:COQ6 monooxygenase [Coprinopsis sp. MPI-PUGE-AT-0042]|nr:COQ6 monooxygenase [Coprinopsis sp. MPI-PUGE-AT-0042]
MLALRSRAAPAGRLTHSLARKSRFLTTQPSPSEDVDVVIVGGGPAGLALASAIGASSAGKNLSVALVEAGDLTKLKEWAPAPGTYSNRVVSLTNVSQSFLQRIGAWNHIEEGRTRPVEEMQVWDGVSDARITFSASEIGLTHPERGMSRLTENFNLQRGLLRHLESVPQVQLIQRTKVNSIVKPVGGNDNWPLVHLSDGRVLRSRLLVGADGFNSPVRTFAGIGTFGWSYDGQAIVATMQHEPRGAFEGPNTTAYQRFLPTGPIAFLPLSPTVSSLVWSTKPPIAKTLLSCDPSVLACMINAAFRLPSVSLQYLYDRILEAHAKDTPIQPAQIQEEIQFRENAHQIDQYSAYTSLVKGSQRQGIASDDVEAVPPLVTALQANSAASFPLRFNHTDSYIGEGQGSRTVLVGDAAHIVHPLAGQGLNMGLGDVECLSQCIEEAVLHGGDIGSYTALLPYAQKRYLENHVLMSSMDKLQKLYSTELSPIVWARSVGLEVVNELDSLKAALMISAGAQPKEDKTTNEWDTAANLIRSASNAVEVTKSVIPGVAGAVLNGVVGLLQQVQQRK